jgi:hypothetical protein
MQAVTSAYLFSIKSDERKLYLVNMKKDLENTSLACSRVGILSWYVRGGTEEI